MRTLIILLLALNFGYAQTITVFHETFDAPSGPDSVTTGTVGTGAIPFSDSTDLNISSSTFFHAQGSLGNETYFTTQAFATSDTNYYLLEFDQIAKVWLANTCWIEYSVDNGVSWSSFDGTSDYLGTSPLYAANDYFNEGGYVIASQGLNLWNSGTWTGANSHPNSSWWAHEEFDIRDAVTDQVAGTGYSQVKLRFRLETNFTPPTGSGFLDGWFVDNVKVTAANCELIKPAFDFNINPVPCYNNKPEGLQAINTLDSTYKFGVFVTDNIDVDSVLFSYRINAGPWLNKKMTEVSSVTGLHETTIKALPGDSVDWFMEAFDPCLNQQATPPFATSFYSFYINSSGLPSKCGTVACGNLPGLINSFPWVEDFEGTDWTASTDPGDFGNAFRGTWPVAPSGDWTVNPSQSSSGYAWGVRTGGTATGFTGPAADHTTGSGSYLYTEGSQGFSPSVTNFITPCIDLRDSVERVFGFHYHMYGADIDGLRIDIDTGSNVISYFQNYSSILGQQQTSSTAPWQLHEVSLAPFKGKVIKIRMRCVKSNPTSLQDIAVDDLYIENSPATDVELGKINSPIPSPCQASTNVSVDIDVVMRGNQSPAAIPVAFQLNQGVIIRDTIFNTSGLALFDTVNFAFPSPLNYNNTVPNTVKVWTELPQDSDQGNDTMQVFIPATIAPIDQFPYLIDFESETAASLANPSGTFNSPEWTMNTANNGPGGARWIVKEGPVRDVSFGPMFSAEGSGNYLLFENTGAPTTTGTAELLSGCIDLTGLTVPHLAFKYWLSTSIDFHIYVKSSSGTQWVRTINSNALSKISFYDFAKIDLSAYSGEKIQVSIRATLNAPNPGMMAAIDDISIFQEAASDIRLINIQRPRYRMLEGTNSLTPIIRLGNLGSFIAGSATLKVAFTEICQGSAYTDTFQSNNIIYNVPSGGSLTFSNPWVVMNPTIPAGLYEMKAWLDVTNDTVYFNDTITREIKVVPRRTIPYFEDFEGCEGDFFTNGTILDWEIDNPDKGNWTGGAHSGNFSAVTHSEELGIGSLEYFYPPILTGFDTIVGAELRFFHKFETDSSNASQYATVEYFANGAWQPLFLNSQGQPCDQVINGSDFSPAINACAFSGTTQNNWIYSSYRLNLYNMTSAPLELRFVSTSTAEGWAIDDLEVYIPPQNSASPTALTFANGVPKVGTNNVLVRISNSGAKPLYESKVTINLNGTDVLTDSLDFSIPILQGDSRLVPINGSLNLPAGANNIVIYTELPNSRLDNLPLDDTLILPAIPDLSAVDSLPYCTDLELGPDLLQFTSAGAFGVSTWDYGIPQVASVTAAHSGLNAWAIDDEPLIDQSLYTRPMNISGRECYEISFWHAYDSEFNFDGGTVEYSIDSGSTWHPLGNIDTNWFNTPFIQALNAINPGWSGSSGGWVFAQKTFSFFYDATVQFRFRYAAGASITTTGGGWAIDDLCIQETPKSCHLFGINELLPENGISLYPNPARDFINLEYLLSENQEASWTILDQRGSRIRTSDIQLAEGSVYQISLEGLAKGVYMLELVTDEGHRLYKKFARD